jgi:hypothetical protein
MTTQIATTNPNSFKLNSIEVGFGAETDVSVRCGCVRISLQTLPLRLTKELHNGLLKDAWKPIADQIFKNGLLVSIDQDLALNGGQYGQVFRFPYKDETGYLRNMRIMDANFFGTLTIDAGLVTVEGVAAYVDKLADATAVMPLSICKQFEPLALIPPRKKLSLAQALLLPPEQVFHLSVEHPKRLKRFDDAILGFTNLESLWLSFENPIGNNSGKRHPFPDGLLALKKLHSLNLQWAGFEIGALSERIGDLAALETLRLSDSGITLLPESITNLQRLALLDLSMNKLMRVPECLGELPKLRQLDLRYNPLRALPKSLRKIASVEVSYPAKALYLNTHIAMPSAPVIDDSALRLPPASPAYERVSQLLNVCSQDSLLIRATLALCRQAIYLAPIGLNDAIQISIGASKTGGAPDLPIGVQHPADENGLFPTFYAQLNLRELAPLQSWLPRRGMLYFYVGDFRDGSGAIVKYIDCDVTDLQRFDYLPAMRWINSDVDAFDPETDQPNIAAATALVFNAGVSLPNFYGANAARFPSLAMLFNDESIKARQRLRVFSSLLEEALPEKLQQAGLVPTHTSHSMNAFVFTQNESPEMQAAHDFGGWATDWINLLSLASLGDFCFGDAGTLSFSIHRHHLADADFSKVVCTVES